ncbi:hypothetical protein COCON_G00224870, partial [Conger conger]
VNERSAVWRLNRVSSPRTSHSRGKETEHTGAVRFRTPHPDRYNENEATRHTELSPHSRLNKGAVHGVCADCGRQWQN